MTVLAHLPPPEPEPPRSAEDASGRPSPSPPARPLRAYSIVQGDRDMLLFCLLIVVAAAMLGVVDGGGSVAPFGLSEMRLPPLCPTKAIVGLDCPGCGLTRSFVATAHGDLAGAWGFHRFGPLFFAIVAMQIPYRGARLIAWIGRRRRGEPQPRPPAILGNAMFIIIAIGLGANWVWSIVARWAAFLAA